MLTETQMKILQAIANDHSGGRPPLGDVCGIQADASLYALATDGHFMLAFAVDTLDGLRLLSETASETENRIRGWLDHNEGLAEISFPKLLAWCKAAEYLRCPCCDGSGKRDVDLGDKFAEGNWKDDFQSMENGTFGILNGLPMARNLMVKTLAYLPEQETVRVSEIPQVGKEGWSPALLIVGDGWRYIQCAVKVTPEEFEALERFESWTK